MKLFYLLVLAVGVFACESDLPLNDLGQHTNQQLANVYMSSVGSDKQQAGLELDIEVQYWSLDDKIAYTGLWDSIAKTVTLEVDVDEVKFSKTYESSAQGWKEHKEYPFDFANWKPESNAYERKITYLIDPVYDQISQGDADITYQEFLALDTAKAFEDEAYDYYITKLSKSYFNDLMVDKSLMSQQEFDALYSGNSLTDAGKETILAKLKEIGLSTLVGKEYSAETKYAIVLAFRVINSTTKSNEYRRSFRVF